MNTVEKFFSEMEAQLKTATFVRESNHWKFYQLSTPLDGYGFVAVSAIVQTPDGQQAPETVIFGSTESGRVLSWSPLGMIYEADHTKALGSVGYTIQQEQV